VKDRVFTGVDVKDAVASAAASLGLAVSHVRYVVLEGGGPGGRGLKPTPARIAVLLDEGAAAAATEEPSGPPVDVHAGIRAVVRSLAAAGHLDVGVAVEEGEEAVVVRLHGSDREFFFGRDGRGEVLRSLEHILQRMFGTHPRPLRLDCEGFRERRERALVEEARQLAGAVRRDGRPRTMEPLNAYERRLVHVALQDEAGVTTYSVGEGPGRRITVAPASAAPGERSGDGDAGD
jgi:spoIIIJ-associated protein